MEHERCYIYAPTGPDERPTKRQRINKSYAQADLSARLEIYRNVWTKQSKNIQITLEGADSTTQGKIVDFVAAASARSREEPQSSIPTGLVIAGPSIASHGPYFERLGRRIRAETASSYVVLRSGESPNLKTFLKNLIKKVTSRIDDDDDDEDVGRIDTASRKGPKLLNFDLGHVQEWMRKSRVQNLVVAVQDSEAFDTALLVEMIDLFYSWLDRLPLVLLFGIATSAESFEDRLTGMSLRYLNGKQFDVIQSDEIIEKLFRATVAHRNTEPHIGPALCRRVLDRQSDHVQSVQDFVDGIKYAYMSHFYANPTTIFLKTNPKFSDFSPTNYEAVRNLPSFRRYVEEKIEGGETQEVRKLLDCDEFLFGVVNGLISTTKASLSSLSIAAMTLTQIRESLGMTPKVRLSTIWNRAASGELLDSPLLRETMLAIKKTPSDRLKRVFISLFNMTTEDAGTEDKVDIPIDVEGMQNKLQLLVGANQNSEPLRSQDDVRNESVRTTVVAQKVLLSKHKAALSERDKAYSEIVARFYQELDDYFRLSLVDPRTLFLNEMLIYDLKSPHSEVFQPKPRFAIERALATPHDYLGCKCCVAVQGGESTLTATQPATAVVYQLYLESGALINASDLWTAFHAIVGKEDDENESQVMALFQRALAELKFLGLVKPSRKKTDHVAKMMWKGL